MSLVGRLEAGVGKGGREEGRGGKEGARQDSRIGGEAGWWLMGQDGGGEWKGSDVRSSLPCGCTVAGPWQQLNEAN
jgi:hypothetical protein